MSDRLVIENAVLGEHGDVHVTISEQRFWAGEKYTILELGWAVYLAEEEVSEAWMRQHGETRPAEEGWNELASHNGMLVTSHPVLVALSLRAWWHRNGREIPSVPQVDIPTFDEAVEEVRQREILNDFNAPHGRTVPGLRRWQPSKPLNPPTNPARTRSR